jgi:hypothetical protein
MENKKLLCIDIYNKEGELVRIECHTYSGEFVMQFLWDIHDPQTSEKREEFRKWVSRHLRQSGYDT